MADYTIIADVSQHICKLLREKLCPEPIPSPNNIEVSSPTSQDVDYIVGLHLYDIKEEMEVARPALVERGRVQLVAPPKPYSLYYMVFINGSGQMGLKAPDLQKIIGKIAQVVSDSNRLYPKVLQPWLPSDEPPIVLSQAKLTFDEKMRVWQSVNKPYQISLFYKAAPVFLSSEIAINTPRVSEANINMDIIGGSEGGGIT